MKHGTSPDKQACIDACLKCYSLCLSEAVNHCLRIGGEHSAEAHIKLMLACAEMCRTAAHFMLMDVVHYRHVCMLCANICKDCAEECKRLGEMDECAAVCLDCAEKCRQLAA